MPASNNATSTLRIDADLSASTGGLDTRIEASGSHIYWRVNDMAALPASLPKVTRGQIALGAETLNQGGLSLQLSDQQGTALEMGAGTSSTVGRILFGTRLVRLRRPLIWLKLAFRR